VFWYYSQLQKFNNSFGVYAIGFGILTRTSLVKNIMRKAYECTGNPGKENDAQDAEKQTPYNRLFPEWL
jgi:hypothetical protein